MCVLHDCFDFIEDARCQGGRVLVHCSQGVSRSATIVVGYCMWKLALPYDDVFDHVKKIRHVVSPNVGFQYEPSTLRVPACWAPHPGHPQVWPRRVMTRK
jgi:protein-tyrosine phosphatase